MVFLEYCPFALYVFFGYTFMLILSERKYSLKLTIIVSYSILSVLVMGNYLIRLFASDREFIFFYPLTSLVTALLLILYISNYDGLRVLYNLLSALFFCTLDDLVIDIFSIFFEKNIALELMAHFFFLGLICVVVYKFVRPVFQTTARYLEKGWGVPCIALFTYGFMLYILHIVFDAGGQIPFRIGLSIIMIVFYVSWCFMSGYMLKRQENKASQQLLSAQVNAMMNQSFVFHENEKKLSILRHDMRHQVAIIQELLNRGHVQEAKYALDEIEKKLEESKTKVYCQNVFVNAAISAYINRAIDRGIKIDTQLDIPADLSINHSEFAVVVANALENAITACGKLDNDIEPQIMISARRGKSNFIFEVANTSSTEVEFDDSGIPVSREENHGIGSHSIDTFAKKYDAVLDYDYSENWFKLRILVNL